jgi:hypothetical protein
MMIEEFRALLLAYESVTDKGSTMYRCFCRNYDGEGCTDYDGPRPQVCKDFECRSKEYKEPGNTPRTLAEAERLAEKLEDQ